MSSKEKASKGYGTGTGYSFTSSPCTPISEGEVNHLVGKLLTYVDATYQDKEQRDAHKSLIKDIVHSWYYEHRKYYGSYEFHYVYDATGGADTSSFTMTATSDQPLGNTRGSVENY